MVLALSSLARAFSPNRFRLALSVRTLPQLSLRRSIMSAVNGDSSFPTEMSEDERYLFDLNGYVIVRGVLTPEQVEEANAMIDKHESEMIQRSDAALRNAVKGTKLYGSGPGRKDLGQVLEWGADSKLFKSILAHPRLVPLYVTVKSTWADSNLCNVPLLPVSPISSLANMFLFQIPWYYRERVSNGPFAFRNCSRQRRRGLPASRWNDRLYVGRIQPTFGLYVPPRNDSEFPSRMQRHADGSQSR